MEERDDKAEKISTIQKHLLTATGSEAVRLNAQLAVVLGAAAAGAPLRSSSDA